MALGRRATALLRALVEQPGAVIAKDALIKAARRGQVVEEKQPHQVDRGAGLSVRDRQCGVASETAPRPQTSRAHTGRRLLIGRVTELPGAEIV